MSVTEFALGFVVRVVFALVATRGGVGIAAVLGVVLAAALLVRAVVRGSAGSSSRGSFRCCWSSPCAGPGGLRQPC